MKCPPGAEDGTAGAGGPECKGKEGKKMPGFDGTGPMGAGPLTGGGRGFCRASGRPSGRRGGSGRGVGRGFGAGFGLGYGRGFGPRNFYPAAWDGYGPGYGASYAGPYAERSQDELSMLKSEADRMRGELGAITKRIGELESKSSPE